MAVATRVGFIGAGKMATALARGILSKGEVLSKPHDLCASCPPQDEVLLEPFRKMGASVTHQNKDLVDKSDVVILAVKPNVVDKVLGEIKEAFDPSKLLISVAAGVKINSMQSNLESKSKVSKRFE